MIERPTAKLEFRRATNADCATAQAIVREALAEHGLGLLLDTSDKDLLDLESHYDARGGAFELIYAAPNDEPVGVLGWRPGANRTVELKKVYLRRSARGQSASTRDSDSVRSRVTTRRRSPISARIASRRSGLRSDDPCHSERSAAGAQSRNRAVPGRGLSTCTVSIPRLAIARSE